MGAHQAAGLGDPTRLTDGASRLPFAFECSILHQLLGQRALVNMLVIGPSCPPTTCIGAERRRPALILRTPHAVRRRAAWPTWFSPRGGFAAVRCAYARARRGSPDVSRPRPSRPGPPGQWATFWLKKWPMTIAPFGRPLNDNPGPSSPKGHFSSGCQTRPRGAYWLRLSSWASPVGWHALSMEAKGVPGAPTPEPG
jgi:hypothetical protein